MKNLKKITQELKRYVQAKEQESPLDQMKWLPPQLEFLKATERRVLYRNGNQLGKSTVGVAEVIFHCLGNHPFKRVRPPPIEAWIVCATTEQSKNIQKKLWDLVPRHELKEGYVYDASTGFRANNPMVEFKNGSIVKFKTTNQDALGLAGASLDFVLIDEPPKTDRLYSELNNRLRATNGYMRLTLTPINADCTWLQALCELGVVRDIHYRLELKNMIPVGETEPLRSETDGRPKDALWIKEILDTSLSHEIPIIAHGEWNMAVKGRAFRAFKTNGPESHIKHSPPKKDLDIYLGIDHGSGRDFSSAAILVGVEKTKEDPQIWILDEYASDGETTVKDDAKSILNMLERNGLKWKDLTRVYGDIAAYSNLGRKSNKGLARVIARELGLRSYRNLVPNIWDAKRGQNNKGSVYKGWKYIHEATLVDGRFNVLSCCERTIECMNKWDWTKDSEYKHMIDALRYALKDLIFPKAEYRTQTISVM